jgi:hypothetical protein
MAKVKIQGHASGTGILTVTAPNTSTDRTITLPDETATLSTFDPDGAVTINDTGADVDFRVESDTITHALFVDGAKGSVGIGVTPETWETGWTGLQVGGLGAIVCTSSANAGGNAWVTNNMYINGAGQLSYIVTDEASRHRQINGIHHFDVAASGSADAAISFTTPLTITNDGRGVSQFTAQNWVNFNGTGTLAIRDSHNISGVNDNGTGDYSINFATDCANANYSANVTCSRSNFSSNKGTGIGIYAASADGVRVLGLTDDHSGYSDQSTVCCQTFGDT